MPLLAWPNIETIPELIAHLWEERVPLQKSLGNRMHDLHHLIAAVFERASIAIFRAWISMTHKGATQSVIKAALQHALFKAMPETINTMACCGQKRSDFEAI